MADLPLEHRTSAPADADGPVPAVVLLHGLGADEGDLLGLASDLPDEARVLSLRGPDPHGPGFSWFEFDGPDPADARPVASDLRRSRDLLEETVDGATERYDVDADRVGLLGFSQGAVLALAALLGTPERYAWTVAAHGFFPDDVAGTGRVERPVLCTAGETDAVVPPERAADAVERLRERGCAVDHRTYPTGHRLGREERVDVAAWVADHL